MKITAITQQVKRARRYSVFVDEEYAFSLSESALLDSKLIRGQAVTSQKLDQLKRLSTDDKLFSQALRYAAMRNRTRWEIETYLQRKEATPALLNQILNKLSELRLLDDMRYAQAYVNDRRLLRNTSRRKITAELKKKRISEAAITEALGDDSDQEREALAGLILRKRRQAKYQNDFKLMQYLARQGFNYDDIKMALSAISSEA